MMASLLLAAALQIASPCMPGERLTLQGYCVKQSTPFPDKPAPAICPAGYYLWRETSCFPWRMTDGSKAPLPDLLSPTPLADADHRRLTDDLVDTIGLIGASCALDIWTTSLALNNDSTAYEMNPFGWDAEARSALKVGTAAVVIWMDYQLRKKGKRRAAGIGRAIVSGMFVAAAVNNVRIGLR